MIWAVSIKLFQFGDINLNHCIFTVRNKVAKVKFYTCLSVILFTGGLLSQHALQVVSQHALQQGVCAIPACIAGGIPACPAAGGVCSWGVPAPGGSAPGGLPCRGPAPGRGVEAPRKQTATVADGTHPTGMHSCLHIQLKKGQKEKTLFMI